MIDEEGREIKELKLPEEKVNDLKKAIAELGFKVEETKDGEIKISQGKN